MKKKSKKIITIKLIDGKLSIIAKKCDGYKDLVPIFALAYTKACKEQGMSTTQINEYINDAILYNEGILK